MAFDAQQKKVNDVLSGDVKYVIPRSVLNGKKMSACHKAKIP